MLGSGVSFTVSHFSFWREVGTNFYFHFTDKAQRSKLTCPRSQCLGEVYQAPRCELFDLWKMLVRCQAFSKLQCCQRLQVDEERDEESMEVVHTLSMDHALSSGQINLRRLPGESGCEVRQWGGLGPLTSTEKQWGNSMCVDLRGQRGGGELACSVHGCGSRLCLIRGYWKEGWDDLRFG